MKGFPMHKLFTLLAVSSLLITSACSEQPRSSATDLPPGKYEKTTRSTNSEGTTTERKTTTEVERDSYGNKKATIENKTTKDPRGLFNKQTTTESHEVIEKHY